jgi:hypothetical protein
MPVHAQTLIVSAGNSDFDLLADNERPRSPNAVSAGQVWKPRTAVAPVVIRLIDSGANLTLVYDGSDYAYPGTLSADSATYVYGSAETSFKLNASAEIYMLDHIDASAPPAVAALLLAYETFGGQNVEGINIEVNPPFTFSGTGGAGNWNLTRIRGAVQSNIPVQSAQLVSPQKIFLNIPDSILMAGDKAIVDFFGAITAAPIVNPPPITMAPVP